MGLPNGKHLGATVKGDLGTPPPPPPSPLDPLERIRLDSSHPSNNDGRAQLHGHVSPACAARCARSACEQSRAVSTPRAAHYLPDTHSRATNRTSQQVGHPSFRRQRASRACESKHSPSQFRRMGIASVLYIYMYMYRYISRRITYMPRHRGRSLTCFNLLTLTTHSLPCTQSKSDANDGSTPP